MAPDRKVQGVLSAVNRSVATHPIHLESFT